MGGILLGVGLIACSWFPGPVPLDGDAHMAAYLEGGTWESRDHEGDRWRFADGGFEATGEVNRFFPDAPDGTTQVQGTWTADAKRLTLTRVQTGEGLGLQDREVPLAWVDGKLHIDIGTARYSRW